MAVWHFPLQKLPGPTVLSPFLYLQLGSANLMIFGSPEPAPYSQLVPNSAREHSPPPVRPGQGHSWGRLGCASTGPQVTFVPRLPLLPAWDVTDLQGKLPAMMPAHVLSPVISREGFQHTVGARVCGCRGTGTLQHEERLTANGVLWSVQKPEQLQLW